MQNERCMVWLGGRYRWSGRERERVFGVLKTIPSISYNYKRFKIRLQLRQMPAEPSLNANVSFEMVIFWNRTLNHHSKPVLVQLPFSVQIMPIYSGGKMRLPRYRQLKINHLRWLIVTVLFSNARPWHSSAVMCFYCGWCCCDRKVWFRIGFTFNWKYDIFIASINHQMNLEMPKLLFHFRLPVD